MIKLYFAPNTRATRALWMLEEVGAPFELVTLNLRGGEHKRDAYRSVHPLGKVPVLVDGAQTIFESAAICLHLGDRFPEAGLAPAVGNPDRAPYYQWVLFSVASIEAAVFKVAMSRRDEEKQAKALSELKPMVGLLESRLGDRDYLLDSGFSAADVLNASIVGWALDMGAVDEDSAVARWINRARQRPAYDRMLAKS